ncbi:hypothetical protein RRG08_013894 [Elysia crispata]|uniref:Methyltransferase type 11 domain-containing protein n=1 Tax=Elysia crispata TaxID=231223 RepID=A0AAE1E4V7_9GAST|nr:hypothetical protein RRG08_013894 [Elysia crispata]
MASQDKDMLSEPNNLEESILKPDISHKESQNLYNKWAEIGTYDDIHGSARNIYKGQEMLGETMEKLFPDKTNVRLLDAGAGTGLTGEKLYNLGYTNIDAVEPITKFTEIIKERGHYRRIMKQAVGIDIPLDTPDNTYDAVCTVGAFGPGAIPPGAFMEFIRVTKPGECKSFKKFIRVTQPGGYIINCMREEYLWTVPQYRDTLQPYLKDLEKQGLLKEIEWSVYPDHFNSRSGVRMLYRVC